ncbi:hypothetical protein A2V82_08985 [candidate division KSB1 bacterium RBG_16_48_16]|nr:MAG: hypothetical protein A2V82_08985 [candidate division KSB1 bacterium RBG_16_48_16]
MTPKDVIEKAPGLTRDQLSYFVKMGYVKPKKYTRGKNEYTEYSENDLLVIEKALYYIQTFDTKPKSAFEKAFVELRQPERNFNRK